MQTVNLINYCEHIILSIPFTRLTYTHAHAHTQWQCCSLLHDVIMWQLQQSQWQKIKLEADPLGVGGGECHSKFSVYPEISVLWIAAFSFDHRRCCRSPIHRWIIPPKSPKSLILFISTPHKKGALFPLLSLYSMVVSSSGFPTSVRTGTSCSNISDWVGFEGILTDVDRDPFYTDANKH